jgi:hypothetical protein
LIVSVVEMVPLISVACVRPAQSKRAEKAKIIGGIRWERNWPIGPPYAVLKVAIEEAKGYGVKYPQG